MLFNKENNALVRASRQALKNAEDKAKQLKIKNDKLERLIIDIAIVQNEKGQGTLVERYDKIKLLVDNYQMNN
jgi:hypothetical protein